MTKRKLLAGLAAMIVLVMVATSCRQAPTPTYETDTYGDLETLDPSGQIVTYWYQHSGGHEEALLGMIDDFNANNEWGITVQGEYAGQYDEIYAEISDGIPSGEVPDISVAYPHQAATYAIEGALVELTPYIESEKWGFTEEDLDDFFPSVRQSDYLPQLDGRFGFPIDRSMEVLYYNEDWLHELGYDHPPRTWEEFGEIACVASSADEGLYGYEFSISPSTFTDMLSNHGGDIVNQDATAYTFDSAESLETLNYLQELFSENCAILEAEQLGDQTDFGTGKVLFTISSTSSLPRYRSAVAEGEGFNWSISPLPTTLDTPNVYVQGTSLSIFRTAPEKQLAAWLFIKWLTEPEQQARWTRASSHFPIRESAASELQDYFEENPRYEKSFSLLSYNTIMEPGVAGYDECRDAISEMLQAIAGGEETEDELESAVEKCNASLEEAAPD